MFTVRSPARSRQDFRKTLQVENISTEEGISSWEVMQVTRPPTILLYYILIFFLQWRKQEVNLPT